MKQKLVRKTMIYLGTLCALLVSLAVPGSARALDKPISASPASTLGPVGRDFLPHVQSLPDYEALANPIAWPQGGGVLPAQQMGVEDGLALLWKGSANRVVYLNPNGLGSSFAIGTSGGHQSGSAVTATTEHCVRDIENVFREGVFGYRLRARGGVEEGPTGRFRIRMHEGERLPPESQNVTGAGGFNSHVESIVRVPGSGESNWMVMGRARPSLGAPFYVFEIGSPPKSDDGERYVKFNRLEDDYYDLYQDNPRDLDRTRAYLEISSTEHIGGMQAMGNIVAMPVTCDSAACAKPSVMFWDFSSPLHPRLVHQLWLQSPQEAHWVSVTSLPSGQLLLIVNRGDDGTTDAYITEDSRPLNSSTRWKRLPRFDISVPQWDAGNGTYQNANFLRGCETGRLYLLAMRQLGRSGLKQWYDDNLVELFRVDGPFTSGDPLRLTYVSGATFERFGDYCQMRGGASVYVEPDGSPVVYCAAGQSDSNALKVSEITSVGWR